MKFKKCTRCGEEKPISNFYVERRYKGKPYYNARCKPCACEVAKEWRIRKYGSNERGHRALWLKHKYNLDIDEYDRKIDEQGGICPICKRSPESHPKSTRYKFFPVDHCHRTGKIRGIICHDCNLAIGLLQEDVDRIGRIVSYLRGDLT